MGVGGGWGNGEADGDGWIDNCVTGEVDSWVSRWVCEHTMHGDKQMKKHMVPAGQR